MASNFIVYTEHAVVESSDLLATRYGAHLGHFIDKSVDHDNGDIVARNAFYTDEDNEEVYTVKAPAKTDHVYLILSDPIIYTDYEKKMTEEKNFYNGTGEVMRGYELKVDDVFTASAKAFAGTPAVGSYVSQDGTTYKMAVSETLPSDTSFIGVIYKQANNGSYRVRVIKAD